MLQQVKKYEDELALAKRQIQDRDQLLKHKDVDLQRTIQQAKLADSGKEAKLVEENEALKNEAKAKDSALVVSHYELHKEKLMRDRLEQKNVKLMERMQKLMMVVETMRRDTVSLEKSLASQD